MDNKYSLSFIVRITESVPSIDDWKREVKLDACMEAF